MQKTRHYRNNITRFSLQDVFVARIYNGEMQTRLHRFKFAHNHIDIDYFAALFRNIIEESGLQNLSEYVLVYPPISLWDRILRGPNHAKKLATIFADIGGIKTVFCPCRKSVFAGHQSRRNKTERTKVQSEYFLNQKYLTRLQGKDIILIDDIITTGYTAHTIGKLLQSAGGGKVTGFFLSSKKV